MSTAPSSMKPENAPGAEAPASAAAGAVATSPPTPKGGTALGRGIDELLADLNEQVATSPTSDPAPSMAKPAQPPHPATRTIPKAARIIPGDPLPERAVSGEEALEASIDQAVMEATARMPAVNGSLDGRAAIGPASRPASPQPKSREATRSPAVVAASNVGDLDAALATAPVSMETPAPIRGPAAALPPPPVAAGIIISGGEEIPTGVIVDKSKPAVEETPSSKAARERKEQEAAAAARSAASPEATRTGQAAATAAPAASPADSRDATAVPAKTLPRLWRSLSIFGLPLLRFSPNARDLLGWFALITLFQAFVVWLLVITAR